MALGTIDTHSEWHHVRWSYPDSVLAHLLHLLCTLTHTPAPRPEHAIALTDDRLCHSVLAAARRSAAVPRGHATTSRRRPPASTATCRQPSARLPTTSVTTSVWTQAPSRIRHRRVNPRHGWRSRGRAVPSAAQRVRVPPRECARTVRSSRKVSKALFQPLIGSQERTPEVFVPKPSCGSGALAWGF